jgi:hypothetical protein
MYRNFRDLKVKTCEKHVTNYVSKHVKPYDFLQIFPFFSPETTFQNAGISSWPWLQRLGSHGAIGCLVIGGAAEAQHLPKPDRGGERYKKGMVRLWLWKIYEKL